MRSDLIIGWILTGNERSAGRVHVQSIQHPRHCWIVGQDGGAGARATDVCHQTGTDLPAQDRRRRPDELQGSGNAQPHHHVDEGKHPPR